MLFLWVLMFVLSWFWFLCFWDGAFVGWESSARAGRVGVWGAGAGLGARVGRPRAGWGPPVIFIAGRPGAALLFWFFGGFGCGALLFVVVRVVCGCGNK